MSAGWVAQPATEFQDQRRRHTRQHGVVTQRVRAFHGWIIRSGPDGLEREHCGHAHQKPGSARRCAEAWAKRLNRLGEGADR